MADGEQSRNDLLIDPEIALFLELQRETNRQLFETQTGLDALTVEVQALRAQLADRTDRLKASIDETATETAEKLGEWSEDRTGRYRSAMDSIQALQSTVGDLAKEQAGMRADQKARSERFWSLFSPSVKRLAQGVVALLLFLLGWGVSQVTGAPNPAGLVMEAPAIPGAVD